MCSIKRNREYILYSRAVLLFGTALVCISRESMSLQECCIRKIFAKPYAGKYVAKEAEVLCGEVRKSEGKRVKRGTQKGGKARESGRQKKQRKREEKQRKREEKRRKREEKRRKREEKQRKREEKRRKSEEKRRKRGKREKQDRGGGKARKRGTQVKRGREQKEKG